MQVRQFQDGLSSVARVVGRKAVEVVFGGSDAYTDGTTVHLPGIDPSVTLTRDQGDVMRGYRTHEALHVRLTDMGKATATLVEALKARWPKGFDAVNAIEDVRIENAGVQEYAGAARELAALNAACTKRSLAEIVEAAKAGGIEPETLFRSLPPMTQALSVLCMLGRHGMGTVSQGDDELLKMADPKWADIGRRFADGALALPTGMKGGRLDEMAGRKGTKLSVKLAEKFLTEIDAEVARQASSPPPPPPPPPPAPSPSQPDQPQGQPDGGQPGPQGQGGQPGPQGQGGQPGPQGQPDGGQPGPQGQGGQPGEQGKDQPQGQGQGQGQGDQPGQAQGQGNGEARGEARGEGKSKPAAMDGAEGQGVGAGAGGAASAGAPSKEAIEAAIKALEGKAADVVKDIAKEINAAGSADASALGSQPKMIPVIPQDPAMVRVASFQDGFDFALGRHSQYPAKASEMKQQATDGTMVHHMDALQKLVSGQEAMVRRVLEHELMAHQERRWQSGYSHGRLPSHRLVDAMMGVDGTHQQREDGRDMDTLIHLSIDVSSSMRKTDSVLPCGRQVQRIEEARMMSLALASALERCGADIEISVWGSYNGHREMRRRSNSAYASAMRDGSSLIVEPCFTTIIKGARDRITLPTTRQRIACIPLFVCDTTPTPTAVTSAVGRIAKTPHRRKVLMVLTDGEPDQSSTRIPGDRKPEMAWVHKYAASAGVKLIGVGFGSNAYQLRGLFSDYAEAGGGQAYRVVMTKLAKYLRTEHTNALAAA